jgi:hypothetical protein
VISELETLLVMAGAVEPESRQPLGGDDEEKDDEENWSSQTSHANASKSRQNVRGLTRKDESDSDFEFDL